MNLLARELEKISTLAVEMGKNILVSGGGGLVNVDDVHVHVNVKVKDVCR